jgi:hypothetical protein
VPAAFKAAPAVQGAQWSDIREEYDQLLPDTATADAELEMWKHVARDINTDDLCELLGHTPNVHCVLKVLLTMPVSTATAECTFSSLRHLNTYLCSIMTEKCLSSLALMAIYIMTTTLTSRRSSEHSMHLAHDTSLWSRLTD